MSANPLRDPRYTGDNRCWPCTALNGALLAVAVAGLAWWGAPGLAAGLAVLGAGAVWLRGYLVPGTPRLTRRLPHGLLRALGAHTRGSIASAPVAQALRRAGVLTADLETDPELETAVASNARDYLDDEDALSDALVAAFPSVETAVGRRALGGGENWFARDGDEWTVHQWESRQVAALDAALAPRLADRFDDWSEVGPETRQAALALCRRGLSTCPDCGEPFADRGESVACCGGRSLVGDRRCEGCGYALVHAKDLPGGGSAGGVDA